MTTTIHQELNIEEGAWSAFLDAAPHLTRGGQRRMREAVLSDPVHDLAKLRRRQAMLREIEGLDAEEPEGVQARLAELEADVEWVTEVKRDEGLRAIYDAVLIDSWMLGPLLNRRSPLALLGLNVYRVLVSPAIGILTPIIYFVIPYLVMASKCKIGFVEYMRKLVETALRAPVAAAATPFLGGGGAAAVSPGLSMGIRGISLLLSVGIYCHGVVSSCQSARAIWSALGEIHRRMQGVGEFVRLATARVRRLRGCLDGAAAEELFGPFEALEAEEGEFAGPGAADEKGLASTIAAMADSASAYAALDVDRLSGALLDRFYALDAAVGITRVRRRLRMTWTEFEERAAPGIDMRGLLHPALAAGAVRNDVRIRDDGRRHAILTGPNAGGKSTLMKSVLACVVISQTLTISPCDVGCAITPFRRVLSHINVADRIGRASMFEAEVRRVQTLLEPLARDRPGDFVLVAMDELFSSTNPIEGIAAAVACAKRIASHAHVVSLTSTHFEQICSELGGDGGGAFEFYQMPVERSAADGKIVFPYRLRKGVSSQRVALELMAARPDAFDLGIVLDALAVKRRLERLERAHGRAAEAAAEAAAGPEPERARTRPRGAPRTPDDAPTLRQRRRRTALRKRLEKLIDEQCATRGRES